jgi:hypothetical protein
VNKNLLSTFLIIPFLILIVYLFLGNSITEKVNSILNKKSSQNTAESTNALDLALIEGNAQLSLILSNIETDDNKSLGYTGQNKMAIDSKDNLYFTYRQKVEGQYEIFVAKVDKNSQVVFNKPVTSLSSTQRVSSIAIDYQDNIHLVWYGLDTEEENLGRQIKYIKSTNGGETWSDPVNIGPVLGYQQEDYWQEHPQISTYLKDIYIVWEGKDTGYENQQIKFAHSKNQGNSWSTYQNIVPQEVIEATAKPASQSRPSITIDSKGNLHLIFYSTLGGNTQQIRYAYSQDKGESWTSPASISPQENIDARHTTTAYLKDKIIAVWRQGTRDKDDGPSQIYYSILNLNENNWTKPTIVHETKNFQYFPAITTNGDTAIISYMETPNDGGYPNEDPEPSTIYLTKLGLSDLKITEPLTIDTNSAYPHLTLNIEKNIFYLIYQKDLNPSKVLIKVGKFE